MVTNMFPIKQPEVITGNAAQRFDAVGNLTDDLVTLTGGVSDGNDV
jgi:hypothetical protein